MYHLVISVSPGWWFIYVHVGHVGFRVHLDLRHLGRFGLALGFHLEPLPLGHLL